MTTDGESSKKSKRALCFSNALLSGYFHATLVEI